MSKFRFTLICISLIVILLTACNPSSSITETEAPPGATATPVEPTIESTESTVAPIEEVDMLTLFVEQLRTAIINQNYTDMQSLMENPLGVGPWRSEWRQLEPAQAVTQFQSNSLPAPTNVQFTGLTTDELTALLGQTPASMFGPTSTVVTALHSTGWGEVGTDEAILFITEENDQYRWSAFLYTFGSFADAGLTTVAAPSGLIYRAVDQGIHQITATGESRLLLNGEMANKTNLQISPDGKFAAYYTDEASKLWLLDIESGETKQLAADFLLSTFMLWGNNETLFVGIFLDPNEMDGPNNGHVSTVNINTGAVQILDETYLSGSRPAISPDGETIAFAVFAPAFTAQLYDATNGLRPFDPTLFNSEGAFIRSNLFNPAWSVNGTRMAWLTSNGEQAALQVYELGQETAVQLLDWDPARFGGMLPAPVWSPNGQWIALEVLANGEEGSGLWLIGTDGSENRLVSTTGSTPHWANDELLVMNTAEGPQLYDVNSDILLKMDLPADSFFITLATANTASATPVLQTDVDYILAQQDVSMYSGPGNTFEVIGMIFDGQTARVTGISEDANWWRTICPDDSLGDCWVTADPAFTTSTNP